MVGDAFQIVEHIQIEHSVFRRTFFVFHPIHVVSGQRFAQLVHVAFPVEDFVQVVRVIQLLVHDADALFQHFRHNAGQVLDLMLGLGGEAALFLASGRADLHDVGGVVANAFQIVDHVEQGAGQVHVAGAELQALDLDQFPGDLLVEEVDDFLPVVKFRRIHGFGGEEIVHGKVIVGHDDVRHAHDFLKELLHRHGRGGQKTAVEIFEPHRFLRLVLAAYQKVRQLFQYAAQGQKQQRRDQIEAHMGDGNLQTDIVPGKQGDPVRQRQERREDQEDHRADDVEQKMHHGGPLGGAVGANGGQQAGDAGADILAEQDEQRGIQTDGARRSQRLQNTDAGRAALQKGRHQRTHQYAHHRVGGVDHHILKALPVPQRLHGGGHHVHAQKQHAQAHGDLSAQLDGGAIARQLQHRAHGGEDNGKVDLHRQHQRGNGGADVRAHDDADGLT